MRHLILIVGLILVASAQAWAEIDEGIKDVYVAPTAFLAATFDGNIPDPEKLWITKGRGDEIKTILGHKIGVLRVAYWRRGDRTAWILEEIGKVKPITTGLVVDGGVLAGIAVLVYRESRGWEVRHDFFTNQFKGARLTERGKLDRPIDGISGATLSVGALVRLARLALYLDDAVAGRP